MSIFALAYASREKVTFDEEQLAALADQSSEKNKRLDITGLLHYRDGKFFQYLEGEETAVRELMDTISRDERHEIVNLVYLGHTDERRFQGWWMRYLDTGKTPFVRLEDVLQSILARMTVEVHGEETVQKTVSRLISKIARVREDHS